MPLKEKDYSYRTFIVIGFISLIFIAVLTFAIIASVSDSSDVSDFAQESHASLDDDSSSSVNPGISLPDQNVNVEVSDIIDEFEHGWIINKFGFTYIYGDCGYLQFNYKTSALERYINGLNTFAETIPEKSEIYNIIIPVSTTFADIPTDIYREDNFYNLSQSVFASTVASKTSERINDITIVSALESAYDNGEYVYFRTDENWTSNGAYYAYKAFCESINMTPYSIDSFVSENLGDFLGSFYQATESQAMYRNPDEFILYSSIPEAASDLTVYKDDTVHTDYKLAGNNVSSNKFNVYLGIDAGRYEINTNVDGERLLIVGDKSVHPLLPFLASHYRKIDYINPEMFETPISEFLSTREYDQIITMCYSTNAISGDYIPSLNILSGVTVNE